MRMKQLDTVRAIAIAFVMVAHYGGAAVNRHVPIGAGSVGVGMFFTLSGFLITGILMQSFDAGRDMPRKVWLDFYARRLLRLMPAYYVVIAALVAMGIEPIVKSWPWDLAYLSNVYFAFGHSRSTVFWSLSVEEQFYLLWPLAIACAPRRWLIPIILGMMALNELFNLGVILGGFSTHATDHLLFANLILLGAGCLLAVVSYRGERANDFSWYRDGARKWFNLAAWLGLAGAILSWLLFPKAGGMVRYFTNDLLCGVFYAWLVLQAAIGIRGVLGRVFDSPVLQYIGRISYGLYLVHNWMPAIVAKYLGPLPKYQAAPIVLLATFTVCILSWHFFERPILKLKARFWTSPLKKPVSPRSDAGEPQDVQVQATAY